MSWSERRGVAVLTVPGVDNSGPAHWQSRWERNHSNITRADLGMWQSPKRNTWVTKLDQAIREAQVPVARAADRVLTTTVTLVTLRRAVAVSVKECSLS